MRHLYSIFLLCTLFLFGFSGQVTAQQTNVDSLKEVLRFDSLNKLPKADTLTINTLIQLSTAYRLTNLDSTMRYAKLAAKKSTEHHFTKGLLESQYLILTVYFNRGEYQQVYDIAQSALEKPETVGYPQQLALMNQLVGVSYASQGNYQQGLEYFLRAKELFGELDNDIRIFQNLNNIGVCYLKLEDYPEALDIFLKLDALHTLDATTISIPVNLGFIYYELKEYDKAEAQLMRVLNFDGAAYDKRSVGLTTFKLGDIALQRKKYLKALAYFNRSIKIYEGFHNELEKIQSLNGIALTYLEMNELDEALDYAEKAFGIAHTNDALPEEQRSAETLYRVYKVQKKYQESLSYLELSTSLSNSLKNKKISREVGALEAEYKFKDQDLKFREAQQRENLKNTELIANQHIIILVSLALLIIVLTVAILQYRNSATRKRANKLLQEKNTRIKEQAEKLEEMNDIKTHLFSIISHDLRGPLSSLYGFITLNEMHELTTEQLQDMIPDLADKFKYTSNLLNNLLNWSRSQLDGYKVVPEWFNLTQQFNENCNVLFFQAKSKNIEIQKDLVEKETQVYADKNMINLVLLNLLSNAIKFTKKDGVIKAWTEPMGNYLKVCIQDNGIGIRDDKLNFLFSTSSFYTTEGTNEEKGTGLGLMLCKDFISKNGGTIWAESQEGEGSLFCFTVPVSEQVVNV